ncbi:tRNA 2-thiouridine(34) synthase MnmA [Candidatus Poribacteria bacterium]|nr:tRNA 2-thiouridine(34) synthase MnmA [Candidatus Poribacteria bacterium]
MTRVITAMSGGVDSSVTAAILLKQGYEVIGVTMRLGSQDSTTSCCSIESIEDARRVANQLKIPFYAVNYETIFRDEVISYFCKEYSSGRTPNPCIICNEKLKFGKLLYLAKELEAEYIATGHYARIYFDQKVGRYILKKGVDSQKDQSYALFSLSQEQLNYAIMPLGDFTKSEVRRIAQEMLLKTAQRPESQELCFISHKNYNRFIQEQMPDSVKPGRIIDTKGNTVGQHPGIHFYTIGQRKGLGNTFGKAMYVIKINPIENTITIGIKEDLKATKLIASHANFISIPKLEKPIEAITKIRYNDHGSQSIIYPLAKDKFEVVFIEPRLAITPGQAAVIYDGDVVIGGGWIENSG